MYVSGQIVEYEQKHGSAMAIWRRCCAVGVLVMPCIRIGRVGLVNGEPCGLLEVCSLCLRPTHLEHLSNPLSASIRRFT